MSEVFIVPSAEPSDTIEVVIRYEDGREVRARVPRPKQDYPREPFDQLGRRAVADLLAELQDWQEREELVRIWTGPSPPDG